MLIKEDSVWFFSDQTLYRSNDVFTLSNVFWNRYKQFGIIYIRSLITVDPCKTGIDNRFQVPWLLRILLMICCSTNDSENQGMGFLLLKETFSWTGYLDNQGLTIIGSFEYVSSILVCYICIHLFNGTFFILNHETTSRSWYMIGIIV